MSEPTLRDADALPTMYSGNRRFDQRGYSGRTAERLNEVGGEVVHVAEYAIFATTSQEESCDNRVCDIRKAMPKGGMASTQPLQREAAEIFDRLAALGLKQKDLAEALGLEATKISKARTGDRQFKAAEVLKALDWLNELESRAPSPANQTIAHRPIDDDDTVEITAVDLSLSMGPGTFIEDYPEEERVRMSLHFVQAITRTPSNQLRLVRGIGDSMEPTLRSGDRIMVDLNERQLARSHGVYWIDHLGTHGIKRLRASGRGKVMIMSDNPLVPDFEVDAADIRIEGRVIWFARDL